MNRFLTVSVFSVVLSLSTVLDVKAQPALVYNISIRGTVNTNNVPFTRNGQLLITSTIDKIATRNGVNSYDVALISGFPAGQPSVGAMQYFTNYALAKLVGYRPSVANSALDLAYVTGPNASNQNCITIQPDTAFLTGLRFSNPSNFSISSSITAQTYFPNTGIMTVCSNDQFKTVTGAINYLGTSFFSSPTPTIPYRATFSGQYAGSVNF